jgi:hypothetical protein
MEAIEFFTGPFTVVDISGGEEGVIKYGFFSANYVRESAEICDM